MKKLGRIFLSLMLVSVMLAATVATASAAMYPRVGDDPDPVGHTHTWTFKGFNWTINAEKRIYKAVGVFECTTCGQTSNVQATVTVTGNSYTATIPASKAPDHKAHTATVENQQWTFVNFEWNTEHGYIAFAVYHCAASGETRRVQATVKRTAKGYRASVTAAQALDGVARYAMY